MNKSQINQALKMTNQALNVHIDNLSECIDNEARRKELLIAKGNIEVIKWALEKQIAKKTTDIESFDFKGATIPIFKYAYCPNCNNYVDTDDDRFYCSHENCGQKLDWSVEE